MKREVALAVLERDGAWLLQLRDDLESILYPGHWGLFGGHLDAGETPSEAVHRELLEEINWEPTFPLEHWFTSQKWTSHCPRVSWCAERARGTVNAARGTRPQAHVQAGASSRKRLERSTQRSPTHCTRSRPSDSTFAD